MLTAITDIFMMCAGAAITAGIWYIYAEVKYMNDTTTPNLSEGSTGVGHDEGSGRFLEK